MPGPNVPKSGKLGPKKLRSQFATKSARGPICQELGAPILLHHIGNAFFFVQSLYISPCILRPTIRKCIFDSDFSHAQQINYFSQTSNKQKLGNFTMKNKHPKTTTNFKIILVGEEPNYYSSVSCVNQPKKKTVMEAIRIINEVWTPSRPFILCF